MAGIADDLNGIKGDVGDLRGNNQVARFAYTQLAYTNDEAAGRASFDIDEQNNIPTKDAATLNVNPTILDRGYQTQASSLTRQLQNHFFGRVSYNLNKIVDRVWEALGVLSAAMGRSDSAAGDKTYIATLDANGRLPSNQLTEDAMEIKTYWDASANSPDLTSAANKSPGNVYYVSTEGTRDIGGGSKTYYVGDVLICNKSLQWERIPVTYVKGGAENASAYRTGKADITKANVGLGNVADIDQSPALKDLTFTADASTVTVGGTKLDGNSATLTGSSLPVASSTQAGIMTAAMFNTLTGIVASSVYPVGSLLWTSDASYNPNTAFTGTTWVRLKDAFIWAAGTGDTVTPAPGSDLLQPGDTGVDTAESGSTSVTLDAANLPSHTHSLGSHTHGLNSHTHGLNSHTHGLSSGSASSGGSWSFVTPRYLQGSGSGSYGNLVAAVSGVSTTAYYSTSPKTVMGLTETGTPYLTSHSGHTHSLSGSTGAASGNTAAATGSTAAATGDTGSTGSGTSFSVLNPCIKRYCWERTH